jgi:RNA polymerase sigma factor (sigma-70 family)
MDASRSSGEGIEEHLEGLRAFVRLRLGRALRAKEESGDLVQSVCREMLAEPRGRVDRGRSGMRRRLLRAAENKIRDRWRHWKRERRDLACERGLEGSAVVEANAGLADWRTPSRQAASREDLDRLETTFRELPPDYREAIVLARLKGWSHARIAEKLGRTESATRTLLSRALARLAIGVDEA